MGALYQIAFAKVAAALASLASSEEGEFKSSPHLSTNGKLIGPPPAKGLKTPQKNKADSLHTERGGWLVLAD